MKIHEVNESNFEEEIKKGEEFVQKKFDSWDRLGKLNISIDEFKSKAAYLCRDPTIWAYATLKDKQNKPLKSYYFQDRIMNDRHRFIHVTAANQIGKTWGAGITKGLHHGLHVNNGSVMLISRSEGQAKGILDEMKWMLRRASIDYEPFEDEVTNRFEYHIKSPDGIGVTPIRVFPPTLAILSFPSTLTIQDETGFWKKESELDPIEYYEQCVEPRSNTTKNWTHPFLTMGQIVSITNPNGQNGLAWWLYNHPEYHQYVYNWLSNPNNSLEEYKKKEKRMNPIQFASVYAARYIMFGGGFINLEQYNRFKAYNVKLAIPQGVNLFLGGDFASEDPKTKGTDWSVFYGVIPIENKEFPAYPRIRVVYYNEFPPNTPRRDIYDEIQRIKNLPGVTVPKFGYDRVGVADSVKNDLIGMGMFHKDQIVDLTYSLPNKSEVYLNFQTLFLQDMIEGVHIPKLQEQLLALKVEKPTGSIHIKVHHKTEGVKDDHPDALANACYVARNAGYVPNTLTIVKPKSSAKHRKGDLKVCKKCEEYYWDGIHNKCPYCSLDF